MTDSENKTHKIMLVENCLHEKQKENKRRKKQGKIQVMERHHHQHQ